MSTSAHHARGPLGVVLIGPALMILVPAGTLVTGVSTSTRTAGPFVVIALLHLLVLAAAVWLAARALRGREPWRLSDLAGPVTLAIGAGLSLFLTYLLAYAVGIQGSAVPRLRQGIPLPPDLPYVVAVGLAIAALLTTALTVLAPLAHGIVGHLRGLIAHRRAVAERSPHPSSDPEPTPLHFATSEADGLFVRLLSPITRVLMVLGGLGSLGCLLGFSLTAQDPDTAELLTLGVVFLPALPMLWAVLESLWRVDKDLGIVMAAMWRTMVGAFVITFILLVPLLLVSVLTPVRRGFHAQHMASIGDGGLVAADASIFAFLGLGALISLAAGLIGGLAVTVAVVIPAVALLRPQQMISENEMSTDPAYRRRNIAAVRVLAALIVMIFVFSILMARYQDDDAPGWAVLLSLIVLIGLVVAMFLLQRVDHAARARSGTSARVENPADPRPRPQPSEQDDDGADEHR